MSGMQSRAVLTPSVWERGASAWPRAWGVGKILPRRVRVALAGAIHPYWHVINNALAARESQDSDILPDDDFTAIALIGSATEPPRSFRSQFYQVVDPDNGYQISRLPVNQENLLGTAQRPFLLRNPYPMPNRHAFLNRTQNMRNAANTAQTVIYGVKEYRTKTEP
jgi:hypothetical protein